MRRAGEDGERQAVRVTRPPSTPAVPGLVTTDHVLTVPLDHAHPDGETLTVYAREVRAAELVGENLPWLLFLQGGPGGRSPRPTTRTGWLAQAVLHHRVLLLDQRGTGRSTPVTDRTPSQFPDAAALAGYLGHFRADSIVRDAELLRAALTDGAPWTTLGQSYGGFCTLTYLSLAPQGLLRCLVTGGLPGLDATAEDVYRRTWPRVVARNAQHVLAFPGDRDVLHRLRDAVLAHRGEDPIRLPNGDPLTVGRLQALGIALGMSEGSAEVHHLLEDAFDGAEVATAFLAEVERRTGHTADPVYAILQEVIYCSGTASRWAAERVRAEHPEMSPDAPELLLAGEMKESAIFRDEAVLAPFAQAMELLNERADWPALYDLDVLGRNEIPVAAAVYLDDLYVDSDLSRETAARVPNVRAWVTDEYAHDGLRADDRVFTRLMDMATGRA